MIRRKISTDPAGWVLIFSFGRRSFSSDRPFAAKDDLFAPFLCRLSKRSSARLCADNHRLVFKTAIAE